MSNEQKKLKDRVNKNMKNFRNTNQDANESLNVSKNQFNEPQFDINYEENNAMGETQREFNQEVRKKHVDKSLKVFGAICIAISIAAFALGGTSTENTSESAKNALKNRVSTAVSAGTILLSKDENAQAKDYTITHKSNAKDTKIWVWDYAAEDGDYVQVFVNGAPLGDAFMIKHKPKEITVPAVGKVQIKGVKDGGGGITYAVRYDINGTSYFNGTSEGESNTYTLNKE